MTAEKGPRMGTMQDLELRRVASILQRPRAGALEWVVGPETQDSLGHPGLRLPRPLRGL